MNFLICLTSLVWLYIYCFHSLNCQRIDRLTSHISSAAAASRDVNTQDQHQNRADLKGKPIIVDLPGPGQTLRFGLALQAPLHNDTASYLKEKAQIKIYLHVVNSTGNLDLTKQSLFTVRMYVSEKLDKIALQLQTVQGNCSLDLSSQIGDLQFGNRLNSFQNDSQLWLFGKIDLLEKTIKAKAVASKHQLKPNQLGYLIANCPDLEQLPSIEQQYIRATINYLGQDDSLNPNEIVKEAYIKRDQSIKTKSRTGKIVPNSSDPYNLNNPYQKAQNPGIVNEEIANLSLLKRGVEASLLSLNEQYSLKMKQTFPKTEHQSMQNLWSQQLPLPKRLLPTCFSDLCLTCSGTLETECTSCDNRYAYYESGNSTCMACQVGQYGNSSGFCSPCSSHCLVCTGQNDADCLQCNNKTSFLQTSPTVQCEPCLTTGTYGDDSSQSCKSCASNCLMCTGPNNADCLACDNSTSYLQTSPTIKCKTCTTAATYGDDAAQNCLPCHSSCLTCFGPNITNCLSCNTTLYYYNFYNNTCFECGIGKFGDSFYQICKDCAPNCQYCTNEFEISCLQCNNTVSYRKSNHPDFHSCQTCLDTKSYGDDLIQFCIPCHSTCLTCNYSSNTSCLTCDNTLYFRISSNSSCQACSVGTYGNDTSSSCLSCCSECQTCVNSTYCLTCNISTSYLNSSSHLCQACAVKKYGDYSTQSCKNCEDTCASCRGPTVTDCLSCNNSLYYWNSSSYRCVACAEKQYGVDSNKTCNPCYSSCVACQGWRSTDCISCSNITHFFNQSSGECVACLIKQYGNDSALACQPCHTSCLTCIGPSEKQCASCDNTRAYRYNLYSMCVLCEIKQFGVDSTQECKDCFSTCLTCNQTGETDCLSCDKSLHYFDNSNRTCNPCAALQYGDDSTKSCKPCHSTCLACIGPNNNNCTMCNNTISFLNSTSSSCDSCAVFTYGNNTGQACQACQTNCMRCTGSLPENCLLCDNTLSFMNSTSKECVPCEVQQYGVDDDQSCASCHESCRNCNGPNENNCTSCDPSLSFLNHTQGKCITCPSTTTFGNDTQQQCLPCHADCLTCQGPTNKECLTCDVVTSYLDIFWNTCVKCAAKYFGNNNMMQCTACDESCKSCRAVGPNACVTCNNVHSYLNYSQSSCDSCPDKYYGVDVTQSCYQCHSTCTSCFGAAATNCASCYNVERYLDPLNFTCILCPLQKFGNEILHSCSNCDPSCLRCSGPGSEECVSCSYQAFKNNTSGMCQLCPQQNYGDANDQTCYPCDATCLWCSGPNQQDCKLCDSVYYYLALSGKCMPCAAFNQYGDSDPVAPSCKACNPQCLKCRGPLATDCTMCNPAVSRLNATAFTCVSCPIRTYGNDTQQTCLACHFSCLKCSGPLPTQCTDCKAHDFLRSDTSKCQECPAGSYGDFATQNCIQCDPSCIDCLGPSNQACTACKPNGYFYNTSASSCDPCHASCLSCSNSADPTNCIKCIASYYAHTDLSLCVDACPAHYYPNPSNMSCLLCHSSCGNCTYYSLNDCTSCASGLNFYYGNCISTCPTDHYYLDTITGNCNQCFCDCFQCSGPDHNDCLKCESPRFMLQGECLLNCPVVGYYHDTANRSCELCHSTCYTCSAATANSCLSCNGLLLLSMNQCQSSCPSQLYYPDSANNVCLSCHASCLTCQSYQKEDCLSCPSQSILFQGQCYDTTLCPINQFLNDLIGQCENCTQFCDTCNSTQPGNCIKCADTAFYWLGNCYQPCPSDMYSDTLSNPRSCQFCHDTCKRCNGPTELNCTQCYKGRYLSKGVQCIEECPLGTLKDQVAYVCQSCISMCKICSDTVSCLQCEEGRFLHNLICIVSCPSDYYPIPDLQLCESCHSSCATCFAAGPTACKTCTDPAAFIFDYSCVKSCTEGYRQVGLSCQACDYKCSQCYGPTQGECTACFSAYFKFGNYCLQSCSNGFFMDPVSKICSPCYTGCATCLDATNATCSACLSGHWFGLDGKCHTGTSACPSHYFQENITNICAACNARCAECRGWKLSDCLSCSAGYYFKDNYCYTSTTCPQRTFPNGADWSCSQCNVACFECTGATNNECSSCPEGSYYLVDSPSNHTCVSSCPNGLYKDKISLTCKQCHAQCVLCQGGNWFECSACASGFFLTSTKCAATCEDGYYPESSTLTCTPCHSLCATCTGPTSTTCTSCNSTLFFLNSQCYGICPTTYYANNANQLCMSCTSGCEECTGGGSNECQRCIAAGQYLYLGSCSSACPSGTLVYSQKRICLSSCPSETYESTGSCLLCTSPCQTCSSVGTTNCLSCSDPLFLQGTTCQADCNDGYYPEITTLQCQPCDAVCSTCNGPYKYNCLSCVAGLFLFDSQCLTSCPLGTSEVYVPFDQCITCNQACQTCNGPTSDDCLICKQNYLMIDGSTSCVQVCPNGFYENLATSTCKACTTGCKKCTGSGITDCIACIKQYLQPQTTGGQKCQAACNTGYYQFKDAMTNACLLCHPTCLTCSNGEVSDCTSCADPYYLQKASTATSGRCTVVCDAGFFPFTDAHTCKPCHQECYHCFGELANQCLACSSSLVFANNFCVDLRTGPQAVAGQRQFLQFDTQGLPQLIPCFDANCEYCIGSGQMDCRNCTDPKILQAGECVDQCGSAYLLNELERICEGVQTVTPLCDHDYGDGFCRICRPPAGNLLDKCYSTCPNGYYLNTLSAASYKCATCNSFCTQCNGSLFSNCQACQPGLYLNVYTSTCSRVCEDLYYGILANLSCQPCPVHCKQCKGPLGATQCLSCIENSDYFFQPTTKGATSGSCVSTCLTGYFKDTNAYACMPCSPSCASCNGPLLSNCISCAPPTFLYTGLCLTKCPGGMYQTLSLQCQVCNASYCAECVDNANKCTACPNNNFLLGNDCLVLCPPLKYGDLLAGRCLSCHASCQSCNGPSSEHCLSCFSSPVMYYLYNSACLINCPDQYFESPDSGLCMPCHSTCQTCVNDDLPTSCTSCKTSLYLWENVCYQSCPTHTYLDTLADQCQACNSACNDCFGPGTSQCINCPLNKYLNQAQKSCSFTCPAGFYKNSETFTCDKCSMQCLTCQGSPDKCDVCDGNRTDPSLCRCPSGTWIQSPRKICPWCFYKCSSCIVNEFSCTTCASNRAVPPLCNCPDGFFDDGKNNALCPPCKFQCKTCTGTYDFCLTCLGDRITNSCVCPAGLFDDNIQILCQPCHFRCEECVQKATMCTKCRGNRQLIPTSFQCICPNGYYEDNKSFNCPRCAHQCLTCKDYDFCFTCRTQFDRTPPPSCGCLSGFYTDPNFQECKQCRPSCKECPNFFVCSSCNANRIGPIEGNCPCPENSIDREDLGTSWCSTATVAVPEIRFTDDIESITVNFGWNVTVDGQQQLFTPTRELCTAIIKLATLQQLGQTLPYCSLDSTNYSTIIIQLSQFSTIKPGDEIQFIPGKIRFTRFQNQTFQIFVTQTIHPPFNLKKPGLRLIGPPDNVTLCQTIQIKSVEQSYSGKRDLEVLRWELVNIATIFSSSKAKQNMQNILDEATTALSLTLTIPALTLEEYKTFLFRVTFQNIVSQQSYAQYTVITSSYDAPSVEIVQDPPLRFLASNRITILSNVMHLRCTLQGDFIEIKEDTIPVMFTQNMIQGPTQPAGSPPITLFDDGLVLTKQPNETFVQIEIAPFTVPGSTQFNVTALVYFTINDIELTSLSQVTVTVLPSPLFVYIAGGNRMNGFAVPLDIYGESRDPDVSGNKQQQAVGVQCQWKCMNLNTGKDCRTMDNSSLAVENLNSMEIHIPKKRLQPYTAFIFTLSCSKANKTNEASSTIIITELDLPQLAVDLPPSFATTLTNINQEVVVNLSYPNAVPDKLFYAAALIYDYNVVATVVFEFLQFRLKFWNHFNDYGDSDNLVLRATVYNPRYYMPSSTTIKFKLNLPPKHCVLIFDKLIGQELSTDFNAKVTGCQDEHSPFTYQFAYYLSFDEYMTDLYNATTANINYLSDFQSDNRFKTLFPRGTLLLKDYNNTKATNYINKTVIVAMALISDSLGGIANITSFLILSANKTVQNASLLNQTWQQYRNTSVQESSFLNLIAPTLTSLIINGLDENATEVGRAVLLSLKTLRNILSTKMLQEQCQKSIQMLADVVTDELQFDEVGDFFNDTSSFIDSQTQQQSQIISDISNNYATFKDQRAKESINKNIERLAGVVDSLMVTNSEIKKSLPVYDNYNITNTTNTTTSSNSTTNDTTNCNSTTDNTTTTNCTIHRSRRVLTTEEWRKVKVRVLKGKKSDDPVPDKETTKKMKDDIKEMNKKTIELMQDVQKSILKDSMTNEPAKIIRGKGSGLHVHKKSRKRMRKLLNPKPTFLNSDTSTDSVAGLQEAADADDDDDNSDNNDNSTESTTNNTTPTTNTSTTPSSSTPPSTDPSTTDPQNNTNTTTNSSNNNVDISAIPDEKKEFEITIAKYESEVSNPFANEVFPYENSTQPVYDAKMTVQGQDYIPENQSANFVFNTSDTVLGELALNQSLSQEEKQQIITENKKETVCIQLVKHQNGSESWTNEGCKSIFLEDTSGQISTKCKCNSVNTVTVVKDVNGLFTSGSENLKKVFSQDALTQIATGRFLQTYLFYVLCLQTTIYIYFLIWSWGKDIKETHTKEQKSDDLYRVQQMTVKLAKEKEIIVIEKPIQDGQSSDDQENSLIDKDTNPNDPIERAKREKAKAEAERAKYKKKLLEDQLFSHMDLSSKKRKTTFIQQDSGNTPGIQAAFNKVNPRITRIMERRLSRAEKLQLDIQKDPNKIKELENNQLVKKGILKQVDPAQFQASTMFKLSPEEMMKTNILDPTIKFDEQEEGLLFQEVLKKENYLFQQQKPQEVPSLILTNDQEQLQKEAQQVQSQRNDRQVSFQIQDDQNEDEMARQTRKKAATFFKKPAQKIQAQQQQLVNPLNIILIKNEGEDNSNRQQQQQQGQFSQRTQQTNTHRQTITAINSARQQAVTPNYLLNQSKEDIVDDQTDEEQEEHIQASNNKLNRITVQLKDESKEEIKVERNSNRNTSIVPYNDEKENQKIQQNQPQKDQNQEEEDEQKQKPNQSRVGFILSHYVYIIKRHHKFLSILYNFDEKVPRPVRLTLYYMQMLIILTFNLLFNNSDNVVMDIATIIIFSICAAIFNGICQNLILFLLKSQALFLNYLGTLLTIAILGACSFVIVAWSAINEPEQLNKWARDYGIQYFQDFSFNQQIVVLIKYYSILLVQGQQGPLCIRMMLNKILFDTEMSINLGDIFEILKRDKPSDR